LTRLRGARSVSELLPAAAEELGRSCGFDRTVISRRRGSTWRAAAVWVAPEIDPAVAAAIRDYLMTQWIPLRPGTLENDLVHRRTAALISADDPKVDRELVTATNSRRYVASPVMPSGDVIGFLQADRYAGDRALTDVDRDNMWTFAEGFGLVFEHLALRERLAAQRTRVRDAFVSAEQGLAALSSDEMLLIRYDEQPPPAPDTAARAEEPPLRLAGLLTAREREVLDLMAAGARNAAIADRLVISEGTVKSHVRTISKKLRASNRADAVARYLRLALREQR
jgi:LuxR family transcriptional regulator, regulator of acetate metabolism